MILKASQRSGAAQLGQHLLKTEDNEHVEVHEVRGFMSETVMGAMKEAQGTLNNYEAAYGRAKIFAQATAQLQQNYIQQRTEIAREQQGTDVMTINLARIWGRISNVLDEGSGDAALDWAERVGGELQEELTDAVQNGVMVDVKGWDTDLPSPAQVRSDFAKLPPIKFPDPPKISRDAVKEAGE